MELLGRWGVLLLGGSEKGLCWVALGGKGEVAWLGLACADDDDGILGFV